MVYATQYATHSRYVSHLPEFRTAGRRAIGEPR
jgi:hypothetical protein